MAQPGIKKPHRTRSSYLYDHFELVPFHNPNTPYNPQQNQRVQTPGTFNYPKTSQQATNNQFTTHQHNQQQFYSDCNEARGQFYSSISTDSHQVCSRLCNIYSHIIVKIAEPNCEPRVPTETPLPSHTAPECRTTTKRFH
jgi:hypothetical protein